MKEIRGKDTVILSEEEQRYRYHINHNGAQVWFVSIKDAKDYILQHKDDYIGHNGRYKLVSVMCGFNTYADYMIVDNMLVKMR